MFSMENRQDYIVAEGKRVRSEHNVRRKRIIHSGFLGMAGGAILYFGSLLYPFTADNSYKVPNSVNDKREIVRTIGRLENDRLRVSRDLTYTTGIEEEVEVAYGDPEKRKAGFDSAIKKLKGKNGVLERDGEVESYLALGRKDNWISIVGVSSGLFVAGLSFFGMNYFVRRNNKRMDGELSELGSSVLRV